MRHLDRRVQRESLCDIQMHGTAVPHGNVLPKEAIDQCQLSSILIYGAAVEG